MIPFSNPPHVYMVSTSQRSQPVRRSESPDLPALLSRWISWQRPRASARRRPPARQKTLSRGIARGATQSRSAENLLPARFAGRKRQSSSPKDAPEPSAPQGGRFNRP